jgi:hypothetical protein
MIVPVHQLADSRADRRHLDGPGRPEDLQIELLRLEILHLEVDRHAAAPARLPVDALPHVATDAHPVVAFAAEAERLEGAIQRLRV